MLHIVSVSVLDASRVQTSMSCVAMRFTFLCFYCKSGSHSINLLVVLAPSVSLVYVALLLLLVITVELCFKAISRDNSPVNITIACLNPTHYNTHHGTNLHELDNLRLKTAFT